MLGKKAPCNGISLDSNKPYDFQEVTYSVPLSFSKKEPTKCWLVNKTYFKSRQHQSNVYQ